MTHTLYQSYLKSDEEFKKVCSLRQMEFNEIRKILFEQKRFSLQHFLITGKRGMGKSTLLRRIAIEAKENFSHKLIPIYLGSEMNRVSKLNKLWEACLEDLAPQYKQLAAYQSSASTKDHGFLQLAKLAKDENKSLLLLIDHFDKVLQTISRLEQHRLREILIEYPLQIIGNCMYYDEKFFSYDAPFYDFFRRVHLQGLSLEQSFEFFKTLARQTGHVDAEQLYLAKKGQLETLHILSGGVPRTEVILFELLIRENYQGSLDYLIHTIDEVTPLYQQRMQSLAPLQREILYHMAMMWDRCSVAELSHKTGLKANAVAGQLKILEEHGYVVAHPLEGFERLKYYEIEERFFNIWILMSENPMRDEQRVLWLTRWLESFYSHEDLMELSDRILESSELPTEQKMIYLTAIDQSHSSSTMEECRGTMENVKDNDEQNLESKHTLVNEMGAGFERSGASVSAQSFKKIGDWISLLTSQLNALRNSKDLSLRGNLALLLALAYQRIHETKSAMKYLQLALESETFEACYLLGRFYYQGYDQVSHPDYHQKTVELIKQNKTKIQEDFKNPFFVTLFLWTYDFEAAEHYLKQFMDQQTFNHPNTAMTLNALLIFKQKQLLLWTFTAYPELVDRYKPTYFCLMRELKDQFPKSWQRMPSDLQKPVDDLNAYISKEQLRLGVTL